MLKSGMISVSLQMKQTSEGALCLLNLVKTCQDCSRQPSFCSRRDVFKPPSVSATCTPRTPSAALLLWVLQ